MTKITATLTTAAKPAKPAKTEPYPVRPIRMPAELWERATAEAELHGDGTTGSAIVRIALEDYLAAQARLRA